MRTRPTLLLALVLALVLAGGATCAQDRQGGGLPLPKPPARQAPAAGKVDLVRELARHRALVADPARFTAQTAAKLMHEAYAEIFGLSPDAIDYDAIDRDPHGLVMGLFEATLVLDARMAELHAKGQLTPEVANAKRRLLRGVRYLREAVLLRTQARQPARLYEHGRPALAEAFPSHHWSVDPEFARTRPEQLPRTFVLLCMGQSNVSAAIARSADEDNTFSHLAIGYRSDAPQTVKGVTYPAGTLFLIESLIETGVILQPLAKHYEGVDRDVIFLVRDPAKQPAIDAAADAFFARARDAVNAGKALGYDFSMGNPRQGLEDRIKGEEGAGVPDPDAYFCAAVGDEIFRKAGVELFPIKTHFNHGSNSQALFDSWGIDPSGEVTAPGDADVSGTLRRVAEAARIDRLEGNHLRQAVLYSIFKWMDEDNYRLRWSWLVSAGTSIMGALHKVHLDMGKVPDGMSAGAVRTFMALDKAANLYMGALQQANTGFKAKHGRSMVPQEMLAWLDEHRDGVDGTRKWLRRMPWAQGHYQLEARGGQRVELVVTPAGMGFKVERRAFDRAGKLVARADGAAKQDDEWLSTDLDRREGSLPRMLRYELDDAGGVRGYAREHVGGPKQQNDVQRKVEQGKKVEGPVHGE
ncbi:MAG: hypothetical protein AB7N76_13130 [Planctomycetota bacterium]